MDEETTAIRKAIWQEEAMYDIVVAEESVDMCDCDDKEQTQYDIDKKRYTAKFIVEKVKAIEQQSATEIGVERNDVLPSPWTKVLHTFCIEYCRYN